MATGLPDTQARRLVVSATEQDIMDFHTGDQASPVTSELAASCCREEKTGVTIPTAAALICMMTYCIHKPLSKSSTCCQYNVKTTKYTPLYFMGGTSKTVVAHATAQTGHRLRITLLRPRHEGLVSCSYAHGYVSSSLVPYIIINLHHKLKAHSFVCLNNVAR